MRLKIMIPAFNEAKTIEQVIKSIPSYFDGINEVEILVINDGSSDNTASLAQYSGAQVISHQKNLGLGAAFQTGLGKAISDKADILVTIDADGQFSPNQIKNLIEPIIQSRADFVTGSRFINGNSPSKIPIIKKWGNFWVAKLISWATRQKINDVSCGFRAYSKEAMLNLNLFGQYTYTQETILDLAYKKLRIAEIPIEAIYFANRRSRVAGNLFKYGWNISNIIFKTIVHYRPLKFFGWSGLIIFALGLGLDIWVFAHYASFGTFSPYKILGFLGAFLNAVGIIIFFMGILADSINKVRLTQEKMLYLAKKKNL